MSELRQGDQVIPADQVQLFREIRVPVSDYPSWFLRLTPDLRATREYPDVLVPLSAPGGALPLRVAAGESVAVWIDVHVPPGTAPGIYEGAIRVGSRTGVTRDLALVLEVWPFAVPQTRHLALVAGLETRELLRQHVVVGGQPYAPARLSFQDPAYQQSAAVIDAAVRLLHDHRCSPVLNDVYPVQQLSPEGRPLLDWSDYDRLVSGILDGTLFEDRSAAVAWPMPVSDRNPPPETLNGWGSREHEDALEDLLRHCAVHFQEKGWLNRHYVWIPLPGGSRGERYEQFERLGALIRGVDQRLNPLCTLTPQPMGPYGWIDDPFRNLSSLVGTWCPPASLADPVELRKQKVAGKSIWFIPDRPPFAGSLSMIAPALHARSIPWQAYRFGCGGVLVPVVNGWAADGKPAAAGSEAALLWPGKPYGVSGPVPSIRLKRLRRGLQDFEYLWLLEQNRRPGVAQLLAAEVFAYGGTGSYGENYLDGRPNGWVTDPTAWTLARRLIARELMAAIRDKDESPATAAPDDVARFEQQVEWARLADAVRGLRAEVEGVRVDIDIRNKERPIRLDAAVTLFNANRDSYSGRLTLGGGPADLKPEATAVPIDRLESRRSARRLVGANLANLPVNAEGVLPMEVTLERESDAVRAFPARACAITSQKINRSINLDGRLDDWPLGTTNVAGDFVLVGALDVPKRGRASPDRASQATIVFACHDRDYLYLAFNCADDRMADRIISRGNSVRYDELWPAGEDLVEVIIDPTHRATDAGDLYHVVVKGNGAVITERGAACMAGAARHADWPAGVTAALDDTSQPDRWTLEIRIPLKALGGRPGIWGINFGRFQARLGEYSSWSGARRYLYSPASLGNIRVE